MEENFKEELKTAGTIMRVAGIFGAMTEFIVAYIPFLLILNVLFFFEVEVPVVFIFLTVFISLFFYCWYIVLSYQIFGRTFAQKGFKMFIVKASGEFATEKDIISRMRNKLWAALSLVLFGMVASFLLHGIDFQWSYFIKTALFFSFLFSPIFLLPIFSKRTQTLTDYFSQTKVLVNYEELKREDRENINRIIEDPTILFAGASALSLWAVLIMVAIAFLVKISGKRF